MKYSMGIESLLKQKKCEKIFLEGLQHLFGGLLNYMGPVKESSQTGASRQLGTLSSQFVVLRRSAWFKSDVNKLRNTNENTYQASSNTCGFVLADLWTLTLLGSSNEPATGDDSGTDFAEHKGVAVWLEQRRSLSVMHMTRHGRKRKIRAISVMKKMMTMVCSISTVCTE